MSFTLRKVLLGAGVATALLIGAFAAIQSSPSSLAATAAVGNHPAFDRQSLWQTWRVYCYSCHVGPKARGGLNLLVLDEHNLDNDVIWEKMLRKMRNREMPWPSSTTLTAANVPSR